MKLMKALTALLILASASASFAANSKECADIVLQRMKAKSASYEYALVGTRMVAPGEDIFLQGDAWPTFQSIPTLGVSVSLSYMGEFMKVNVVLVNPQTCQEMQSIVVSAGM